MPARIEAEAEGVMRQDLAIPNIPAMTNETERLLYYRLAKECAGKGAIVELGAWLGASTAYIAAGIRDSGVKTQAHVYDRFISRPLHAEKVKAYHREHGGEPEPMPEGDCRPQFRKNLGPLLRYVVEHKGEIAEIAWGDEPVALLITDAPKRVRAIAATLTIFGKSLRPGALMTWQDFCHYPSYEIPASLWHLREKIEFVEATVPGSTLCFRIKKQWDSAEVSEKALSIGHWTPEKVKKAWAYWLKVVPEGKRGLFMSGAALFLSDIGDKQGAKQLLAGIISDDLDAVLPKWKYIHDARPNMVARYRELFEMMPC